MNKIRGYGIEGRRVGYSYRCPGCNAVHSINVHEETRPRWDWNGSLTAPTFTPSVLVTWPGCVSNTCNHFGDLDELHPEDKVGPQCTLPDGGRCHHFIRDGRIEFLSDCTHALAGTTVDLPDRGP